MDRSFWIFVSLTAMCIGCMVWGGYIFWRNELDPREHSLLNRLNSASRSATPLIDASSLALRNKRRLSQWPPLERMLSTLPGVTSFDLFLLRSGLKQSTAQMLTLASSLMLMAMTAGAVLHWPVVLTLVVLVLGPLVLASFLQHQLAQRVAKMEKALPNALDLIARAMQAGHAFNSALQIAAKECAPPLSNELRTVFEEINFGVGAAQALQTLSKRVTSEDIRYFVVAVIIQSETGGNLAEVLKNTAFLIRERQKMAGVVRVLSAEGRISAVILSLMPFVLVGVMSLLNTNFVSKLWTDPIGLQLVYFSLALMGFGILWMWKLIKIRV